MNRSKINKRKKNVKRPDWRKRKSVSRDKPIFDFTYNYKNYVVSSEEAMAINALLDHLIDIGILDKEKRTYANGPLVAFARSWMNLSHEDWVYIGDTDQQK